MKIDLWERINRVGYDYNDYSLETSDTATFTDEDFETWWLAGMTRQDLFDESDMISLFENCYYLAKSEDRLVTQEPDELWNAIETWMNKWNDRIDNENLSMHSFAVAVFQTQHGKIYSQSFNPDVIDAHSIHPDDNVLWISKTALIGTSNYPNEIEALDNLLDDCPEEYIDVASHAID